MTDLQTALDLQIKSRAAIAKLFILNKLSETPNFTNGYSRDKYGLSADSVARIEAVDLDAALTASKKAISDAVDAKRALPTGTVVDAGIRSSTLKYQTAKILYQKLDGDFFQFHQAFGTGSELNDHPELNEIAAKIVADLLGDDVSAIDTDTAKADAEQTAKQNEKIESAKNFAITFGKYRGKTMGEIFDTDSGYVGWLARDSYNATIKNIANILVA